MRVRSLLYILFIGCLCFACGTSTNETQQPIVVSAAVSLKDAFGEIAAIYRIRYGREVTFNFGSSGALQKQIETGAPADVFVSAGRQQMDALIAGEFVDASTVSNFARNRLVLIVPKDSKLSISTLNDLSSASVKRIAMGNPKTVPAGQYSEQVLIRTSLLEPLKPKLVYGEDVRQVLDYVARGEVDAGLVYSTDAKIADEKIHSVYVIPAGLHDPILYPISVVRESKNRENARVFVELVQSSEGQAVLKRYGFSAIE